MRKIMLGLGLVLLLPLAFALAYLRVLYITRGHGSSPVAVAIRHQRAAQDRLLDVARADDIIVVWKLDRLSRSLQDLLRIMERIGQPGAPFRSLTENVDTTTPAGPR